MVNLPYVKSFRDLLVYKKARELSLAIFQASQGFPRGEMFSLTDQVRRSSRSIGAQIAEAWAKKNYEKHFLSKLTDADGEQQETQHWLETARDCGYLTQVQINPLLQQCEEIGRLLGGMMAKSHLFCPDPHKSLREPSPEYFTQPNTEY